MNELTSQVLISAKEVGCSVEELSLIEKKKLFEELKNKFSDNTDSPYFWETFLDRYSLQDKNAWERVGDYSPDDEVIMLFLDDETENGVAFQNGKCIPSVLWNCNGFEFYLTNRKTSFLIVFNHHNFLIGVGEATNWVKEMKK